MTQDPTMTPPPADDDTVSGPTLDAATAATTPPQQRFAENGTDRFAETVANETLSEVKGTDSHSEAISAATAPLALTPLREAPDEVPVEQIAGVQLKSLLGKGGMGSVYLGHHEAMDLDVAVKLVHPRDSLEDRFLQECRIAARITHDNVVRVFNAGKEDDRLFLVLELVTGGDVNQLVKAEGKLPWRRAVDIVRQAALGLGAAHQAGIVHRDIKPGNLMLSEDGTVKVADLGLAKTHECDINLTQSGMVMGTPAYMSPEQAVDVKRAGPPADVYALGITMFVLLSGELPFKGTTSTQVILAHINDPIPDLRKLVDNVPEEVIAYTERMLAKEEADRPQVGSEVAEALAAILASDATANPRRSPASPPPMRAVGQNEGKPVDSAGPSSGSSIAAPVLIGLIVVIGLLAVIAVSVLNSSGAGEQPPAAGGSDGTASASVVTPPPGNETASKAAAVEPDAWQTPERAVFVLGADADPTLATAIDGALRSQGLRIIEREAIDVLIQEQGLVSDGLVSQDSAIAIGRAKGGHLGLILSSADGVTQLRTVVVETTESAGSALVSDAGQAGEAALAQVSNGLATLKTRGRIGQDPIHGTVISLGSAHGVEEGDSFYLFEVASGDRLNGAAATISAVRGKALSSVTIIGQVPEGVSLAGERATGE